jgi:hypothetical protein
VGRIQAAEKFGPKGKEVKGGMEKNCIMRSFIV